MTTISAEARRLTIEQVLAFLDDSLFREQALDFLGRIGELRGDRVRRHEVLREIKRLALDFEKQWGVIPPLSRDVLDQDPRHWLTDAIASGQWGTLLITPSTSDREIRGAIRRLRQVVGKRHQDALVRHRAELVQWLTVHFKRPTVALAVFGRRTGLRRVTTAQAIARVPEDRERKLYDNYKTAGLTHREAQRRVYKLLRGSEALASAAVRMSARRYDADLKRLGARLARPVNADPVSHALTKLFRALPDIQQSEVRRLARAVGVAFDGAFRARPSKAHEEQSGGPWAILPIFPWTTDLEIRQWVRRIRAEIRSQPHTGGYEGKVSPALASEPITQVLWRLFTAALDGDSVRIQHYVRPAMTAILQIEMPRV